MAGRSRTASSPSSTLILLESYESPGPGTCGVAIERNPLCVHGGRARCTPAPAENSNSHGHDDVSILLVTVVGGRPQLAGAVGIAEVEHHVFAGHGSKEIEQVLRVEPDLHLLAVVVRANGLLALARVGKRGMYADLAIGHLQPNRPRALVGKLRNALDRRAKLVPRQADGVAVFLRQHPLKIRKVAGQLAAQQQPVAKLEKQMILVAAERDLSIIAGILRQLE